MPRVATDDDHTELVNLTAFGVSLVKRGANKKRIALTKGLETSMEKILEILKSYKAEGEAKLDELCRVAKMSPEATDALKSMLKLAMAYQEELPPELMKQMMALAGVEQEAPPPAPTPTDKSVDVLKSLDGKVKVAVEAVLKAQRDEVQKQQKKNEELESIIKAERNVRLTREFVSKAEKDFAKMPGTHADFGVLLKDLHDVCDEKLFARVEKALSDAHAVIKDSSVLKEHGRVGSGGSVGGDTMTKIEALAKDLITKSETKLSRSDAIVRVLAQNPDLYAAYNAERTAR
jgi:hypothetical protein